MSKNLCKIQLIQFFFHSLVCQIYTGMHAHIDSTIINVSAIKDVMMVVATSEIIEPTNSYTAYNSTFT